MMIPYSVEKKMFQTTNHITLVDVLHYITMKSRFLLDFLHEITIKSPFLMDLQSTSQPPGPSNPRAAAIACPASMAWSLRDEQVIEVI